MLFIRRQTPVVNRSDTAHYQPPTSLQSQPKQSWKVSGFILTHPGTSNPTWLVKGPLRSASAVWKR